MSSGEDGGNLATLLRFGHLLKCLRNADDLTQEELAERANVSARLISDLERGGSHRPRRDTVQLLADGLGLRGPDRDSFIALARGRPPAVADVSPAALAVRHNLPRPPTPIVGRLKETAAATALLLDPDVSLLTLTGPGGVGKTRLALEVADRASAAMRDGLVFVDLSSPRDPELVLTAIAQALGLVVSPELSPRQVLLAALRYRHILLVLDNFEHLAAAASDVADLLATCSNLTVLATSRTPLHLRAEREYAVGPLALPDQCVVVPLDELAQIPAVELFVRRAEVANPAFALTPRNASEVAALAVRLDGLPLAIELAATRIKVLSPAALLARLERRLPLLSGGAQDLPMRQQTLRATLDWSHDLLSLEEQSLFRRLSVFAGSCTLEAAEQVGGRRTEDGSLIRDITPSSVSRLPSSVPPPSPPVPIPPLSQATPPERSDSPPSVFDLLSGLIDKSLLRVHGEWGNEQRFGMLETIREYGQERLAAAGEEEEVRDRHAAWCLDLAERAALELDGDGQIAWIRHLDIEHDNLRAALGWAMERRNGGLAQRLGEALARFWIRRGHVAEGRRWLEQALALEADVSPTVRAGALVAVARLAYRQGDYSGVSALEEALALFRAAGDVSGLANALGALGMVLEDLGDHARATPLEEEAIALFRTLGDHRSVVRLLVNRGLANYDLGDYDRAATLLEEALALGRSLGSWYSVGHALNNLALVAQERQDYERAETLQAEALDVWQRLGNDEGIADCFENFAMFSVAQNQSERAARLFGAAHALRSRIGIPGRPIDREYLKRFIAAARADLGEQVFASAWAAGEATPLTEVAAYALGE